jgi:NADP-dependent 3-hydroxy acid dehydrogenase YdfG
MIGRLKGKTALVTSAAQGIGRASVLAMVAEGASVVATDINEAALASLAKESPAIRVMRLDVTRNEEVEKVAAAAGTPDVLFNCSGIVHSGSIMEVTDKDWDFAFDLNVRAHYRMMRAFTPGWLAKGKASVINMASLASSVKGVPNRFLYGTSKAAVIGMTGCGPRAITKKPMRLSLPGSRWGGLARQRKSPHWWFIWQVMKVRSSPDRPSILTVAGPSRRTVLPPLARLAIPV